MPKHNKGKDKIMSIDQFVDDENQTLTPKEKYIISGLENKIAERDQVIRDMNRKIEQLESALKKQAFASANLLDIKRNDEDDIEFFNMLHNKGCYVRL